MSERVKVLNLIKAIAQQPRTTPALMALFGVSERTIKGRIAEARKLGAQLNARQLETNDQGRLSGPYYWEVVNLDEIQPRLGHWLRLEASGSLLRADTLKPVNQGESS